LSFPLTLSDGESIEIGLWELAYDYIREAAERISITAYDSEGRSYLKHTVRGFNPKTGQLFER